MNSNKLPAGWHSTPKAFKETTSTANKWEKKKTQFFFINYKLSPVTGTMCNLNFPTQISPVFVLYKLLTGGCIMWLSQGIEVCSHMLHIIMGVSDGLHTKRNMEPVDVHPHHCSRCIGCIILTKSTSVSQNHYIMHGFDNGLSFFAFCLMLSVITKLQEHYICETPMHCVQMHECNVFFCHEQIHLSADERQRTDKYTPHLEAARASSQCFNVHIHTHCRTYSETSRSWFEDEGCLILLFTNTQTRRKLRNTTDIHWNYYTYTTPIYFL